MFHMHCIIKCDIYIISIYNDKATIQTVSISVFLIPGPDNTLFELNHIVAIVLSDYDDCNMRRHASHPASIAYINAVRP